MNQKDTEILLALKPLETLWTPLPDSKAAPYIKHLQAFDLATIRKAVERVEATYDGMRFPPVAALVRECEKLAGDGRSGVARNDDSFPWEKRARLIATALKEYLDGYRHGLTYAQACAEKWDYYLMRYIREAASVQAQYIFPAAANTIAINWSIVSPGNLSCDEDFSFCRNFLRDCKIQAATGMISVALATSWITIWQSRAKVDSITQEYSRQRMAKRYGVSLEGALPAPELMAAGI